MPTGVPAERDRIETYVKAGACGVGIGPGLITEEWLSSPDVPALAGHLGEVIDWVDRARPS